MRKLSLFMALLLVVVVFTLQNTESITIRFLFWQFSLSRALMLFLVLGIGVLLGFLLGTLKTDAGKRDAHLSAVKDQAGKGT